MDPLFFSAPHAFAPHMFAFNFSGPSSEPGTSYDHPIPLPSSSSAPAQPQHDHFPQQPPMHPHAQHHHYSADAAAHYVGTSTPTSSIDTPVEAGQVSHPMIAGEHYDAFQHDYSPLRGHYPSYSNWMPSEQWDNAGMHTFMPASAPKPPSLHSAMAGFDPASAPHYAPERHHPCAFAGGHGAGVCSPVHQVAQQQCNYAVPAAQMAYASGSMQHPANDAQLSIPHSSAAMRQDQEATMTVTISVKTQLSPSYAPHQVVPSQSRPPPHTHTHGYTHAHSEPTPHYHSHSHAHVQPAYHPQQQLHQHPSSYHNQIQYHLPHLPQHHVHPVAHPHPNAQMQMHQMQTQMSASSQGGLPASIPASTFVPAPSAYAPHLPLVQTSSAHVPLHQPKPVHPPPEWTKIPSPTVEELFPLETLGTRPSQEGAAWAPPVEHARIEELPEEEDGRMEGEEEEDEEDDEEEEGEEEDVEMEESDEEEEEYYEVDEPPQESLHAFHFGAAHPSRQSREVSEVKPTTTHSQAQGTLSSTSLLCQPISAAVRDQFRVPHTQVPMATSGARAYSWT